MIRPAPLTPNRRAFTLVEMLVVITVIGILASFVLGALYVSGESAKRERTISVINKLHALVMQRYETYANRRVPMDPLLNYPDADPLLGTTWGFNNPASPPATMTAGEVDFWRVSLRKLWALRELMRAELPDQYEDVYFTPLFAQDYYALQYVYRARIDQLIDSSNPARANATANLQFVGADNAAAECLYMILTTPFGDEGGSGGTISERDRGDTDNDGMPEFIDGWGNPIQWIRWPAGFVSDLQPLATTDLDGDGNLNDRDATRETDAFDPRGIDRQDFTDSAQAGRPRSFRLIPLILSSGQDGLTGIMFFQNAAALDATLYPVPFAIPIAPATLALYNFAYHDPYQSFAPAPADPDANPRFRGTSQRFEPGYDGEDLDNITNHLLQTQ